jgi:hypothetical protein
MPNSYMVTKEPQLNKRSKAEEQRSYRYFKPSARMLIGPFVSSREHVRWPQQAVRPPRSRMAFERQSYGPRTAWPLSRGASKAACFRACLGAGVVKGSG